MISLSAELFTFKLGDFRSGINVVAPFSLVTVRNFREKGRDLDFFEHLFRNSVEFKRQVVFFYVFYETFQSRFFVAAERVRKGRFAANILHGYKRTFRFAKGEVYALVPHKETAFRHVVHVVWG